MIKSRADRDRIRQKSADKKINHKRGKLTAKQRGEITAKVAAAVDARADGKCEWCGWQPGNYDPAGRKWGLQRAHLIRRPHIGAEGTKVCDVAKLCGPSVNTGTCHWKVDYTTAGREWAREYAEYLKSIEESRDIG